MLRIKPDVDCSFRYVYYAMSCIQYVPKEHSRQWISIYSTFKIPVPPLPVQEEIVRILDSFSSLEAELEAELEARSRNRLYSGYLHPNLFRRNARIQLVSATAGFGSACFDCSLAISSSHTSLGVLYPRSFMGVSLISPTIASSSSCVRSSKLVPLGR